MIIFFSPFYITKYICFISLRHYSEVIFTSVSWMVRVSEKKKREERGCSWGAQIAIRGLQAPSPEADNRQTVRRGAGQGTPDWISAWELLNEGHLEGPRPEPRVPPGLGETGLPATSFVVLSFLRTWRFRGDETAKNAKTQQQQHASLSRRDNYQLDISSC